MLEPVPVSVSDSVSFLRAQRSCNPTMACSSLRLTTTQRQQAPMYATEAKRHRVGR